jgi:acetyl esterase/lipase
LFCNPKEKMILSVYYSQSKELPRNLIWSTDETMSENILFRESPNADFRESYGEDPYQFVELFIPRKKGPCPIIFFIHGGFWKSAYDVAHARHICKALTEKLGVATVNIEYRRIGSTGGGWPFTFQDVGAAADFLPTISEKFNLDLSRAVSMGHSAGGHLAFWVAMRAKIQDKSSPLFSKDPFKFKTTISLAGVVNLKRAYELKLGGGIVKELIGGDTEKFSKRYNEASPFELMPCGVPMVLIHGVEDEVVPFSLSKEFAEKASSLHENMRLVGLKRTGHFELIDPKSKQFSIVRSELARIIVKL